MKPRKLSFAILLTFLCALLLGTGAFAESATVATIGSKKYTSLESAIKKVKSGQTIVLKQNVSYTEPLIINRSGKRFTINLNKKTITFANEKSALVVRKGNVTLKNGTLKQTTQDAFVLKNEKNGKLTIESGTYQGCTVNSGTMTLKKGTFTDIGKVANLDTAVIKNTGTLTISGGTVKARKTVGLWNRGTMTIKGGTFQSALSMGEGIEDQNIPEQQKGTLIYNDGRGKLTIQNGKFASNVLILLNGEKASVIVNTKKGTFTSKEVGNLTNFGKATITGGTWTEKEGGWGVFYNWGTMTLKGVTVRSKWSVAESYGDGTISVKSGTFTSTVQNDLAMLISFGGRIKVSGGTFTGKKTWGCWEQEDGSITVSSKATMKVIEQKKAGWLFSS